MRFEIDRPHVVLTIVQAAAKLGIKIWEVKLKKKN
jgi:hypothetical protein